MIVVMFGLLAGMVVLIAAPWRASTQLTSVSHTYLLAISALVQVPVLSMQRLSFGPLLGAICIGLWVWRNLALPGAWLLLLGSIANGLAMASHGGAMPLDPTIADKLQLVAAPHRLLPGSKDVIGHAGYWLWLSDWLVLSVPFARMVVSPGDVCIVLALVRWAYACRLSHTHPRISPCVLPYVAS